MWAPLDLVLRPREPGRGQQEYSTVRFLHRDPGGAGKLRTKGTALPVQAPGGLGEGLPFRSPGWDHISPGSRRPLGSPGEATLAHSDSLDPTLTVKQASLRAKNKVCPGLALNLGTQCPPHGSQWPASSSQGKDFPAVGRVT